MDLSLEPPYRNVTSLLDTQAAPASERPGATQRNSIPRSASDREDNTMVQFVLITWIILRAYR